MNEMDVILDSLGLSQKKSLIRVAAYCRVSKGVPEQEDSLQAQISYYEDLISASERCVLVGVYADIASGLRVKKRKEYQRLRRDCKKGKIDVVITKSLERLGRDALELIKVIRQWKAQGIILYLEAERKNVMKMQNLVIEMRAAIAQQESMSKSAQIKFGIRHSMACGKVKLNGVRFLGYAKDENDKLVVVPQEAVVVRKIFELYLQGNGCRKIKQYLEAHQIKTVTGKAEWSTSTIDRMLSNEKYVGDVLMQKSYTPDPLTGRQVRNEGQQAMYFIENNHEAIIEREAWELVQRMKAGGGGNAF